MCLDYRVRSLQHFRLTRMCLSEWKSVIPISNGVFSVIVIGIWSLRSGFLFYNFFWALVFILTTFRFRNLACLTGKYVYLIMVIWCIYYFSLGDILRLLLLTIILLINQSDFRSAEFITEHRMVNCGRQKLPILVVLPCLLFLSPFHAVHLVQTHHFQ